MNDMVVLGVCISYFIGKMGAELYCRASTCAEYESKVFFSVVRNCVTKKLCVE